VAGKKYDDPAFTLFVFTMFMVVFQLKIASNGKLTHELHLSFKRYIPNMKQMLTVSIRRLLHSI